MNFTRESPEITHIADGIVAETETLQCREVICGAWREREITTQHINLTTHCQISTMVITCTCRSQRMQLVVIEYEHSQPVKTCRSYARPWLLKMYLGKALSLLASSQFDRKFSSKFRSLKFSATKASSLQGKCPFHVRALPYYSDSPDGIYPVFTSMEFLQGGH